MIISFILTIRSWLLGLSIFKFYDPNYKHLDNAKYKMASWVFETNVVTHNPLQLNLVYPRALSRDLSTLLFISYLSVIFSGHVTFSFSYADETQLYFSSKPIATLSQTSVSDCLNKIKVWFSHNCLKLNGNKLSLFLLAPDLPHLNQIVFHYLSSLPLRLRVWVPSLQYSHLHNTYKQY